MSSTNSSQACRWSMHDTDLPVTDWYPSGQLTCFQPLIYIEIWLRCNQSDFKVDSTLIVDLSMLRFQPDFNMDSVFINQFYSKGGNGLRD